MMSHRKRKETKQQPGTAGQGNILGCCLVSLHFPCNIPSIHSVRYACIPPPSSPQPFFLSPTLCIQTRTHKFLTAISGGGGCGIGDATTNFGGKSREMTRPPSSADGPDGRDKWRRNGRQMESHPRPTIPQLPCLPVEKQLHLDISSKK